ncbi:uncharacterized protein LOC131658687 [Vicia villosa]|uniref:uncharacterized protein LOC131658687 n=1 Tax=Vicia villosa TaxID=3911 RepID=UPI00273B1112|nr:uncharacterized protein LOC131658687 [Vicia villosa]
MICWNVRRLNKSARCLEVGAHLRKQKVICLALFETHVKMNNCSQIRKKLGFNWEYTDNYDCHTNGRIWLAWNPLVWSMTIIEKSGQFIHTEVYAKQGGFSHYLTVIYAHNQITNRRILWQDLQRINDNINGPWISVGDYNNVLKVGDRLGGNDVHLAEFIDMESMMNNNNLFEHDTTGPVFTWFNRQMNNPIYSRIDRALVNIAWCNAFPNCEIEVLNSHISDHSPLRVKLDGTQQVAKHKQRFKFLNCVADHPEFLTTMKENWSQHASGYPMYHLWKNLQRLQFKLKGLNWKVTEGIRNLRDSREQLDKAQSFLNNDPLNPDLCHSVKIWTEEVMRNAELEEKILHQKTKKDWISLGDGNNAYFYAKLKTKNRQTQITML